MTGQNDRPDESLTGQAHDQAGYCPLTGRYFEPCVCSSRFPRFRGGGTRDETYERRTSAREVTASLSI